MKREDISVSSQVCKVPASELSIGNIICGVNDSSWSTHYELTRKASPVGTYCQYHVRSLPAGIEDLNWSPPVTAMIWVKEKMFKYDPKQAGDTDDDV
jgi:hypothetical protein